VSPARPPRKRPQRSPQGGAGAGADHAAAPTPAAARPGELPGWLTRRSAIAAAVLLGIVVWATAAGYVWLQRQALRERGLQSASLYARVLEDQVSRSFAITDVALGALADTLDFRALARLADPAASPAAVDEADAQLIRAVRGLPFLRSVSVLASDGRVLASSNPINVGTVVPPSAFDLRDPGRASGLDHLLAVRDLGDLAGEPPSPRRTGATLLPVLRRVDGGGSAHWLVAAINLDHFANQFGLMLGDERRDAALLSYDGHLLAATPTLALAPDASADAAASFRNGLDERDIGSAIGIGVAGGPAVGAWRAARNQPLLVVVEEPLDGAMQPLQAAWRSALAVACGLTLLLVGLAAAAVRSLRSHDAVSRQLAAADLRRVASERDLRVLIEGVHEWMFRTDAQGRVTFVNRRWSQISQYTDAQALGRRIADWVVPVDREAVDALFDRGRAQRGAAAAAEQIGLCTARGTVVMLELGVSPLRDDEGELIGFAGFAVDVSEREHARRRLQEQLDFTARLIDATPTPIFVKDVDGRFITTNHAWSALLGVPAKAAAGATSAALFPARDATQHALHDLQALATPEPVHYESRVTGRDGSARDLLISKVRFPGPDGRPAGVIGSLVDVTEFREAERRTRQAQQAAEASNQARAEFLANITHELRTPLQSIIGFSELGQARAAADERLQQMFGRIHGAGERMLALVNNLLDVSKIESGVGGVELSRADVRLYVGEVLSEFDAQFESTGLRLIADLADDECVVDVDPTRFQQVIRNVIANAARFAPGGSALEITVGPQGAEVVVEIRDHGPGIPEAECESIFEPFVQSSRTKDGSGGTGLGLAICRKIMHAHRGSIRAGNHPQGGAVFRIALPQAVAQAGAEAVDAAQPA